MQSFKRQIYKISHFEEPKQTPPEVDDSRKEFVYDSISFEVADFTNNFRDADGDSYDSVRIRTLPQVGDLTFNGAPVVPGAVYKLDDITNLTYTLPDNYMATENGFCKFEKSIDEIIQEKENENYELVHLGGGFIQFEKKIKNNIPNNADIYAFFDITSMKIQDAEAAYNALQKWYDDYKQTNDLYEGELYILPIYVENWLSLPYILHRGSSSLVGNNPALPDDDFMAFANIPPNFDTTSSFRPADWEIPENVVLLSFIDEVDSGDEISGTAYHRNKSDYGFSQQPSPQYIEDYNNFLEVYPDFNYFKAVVYPIPDIEENGYNNTGNATVLQAFAAIDGKPTYTISQLENKDISYVRERKFHWHLDINNLNYTGDNPDVANPYSEEAENGVQPLNTFGWTGVYNKDQPAIEVFTSDTFEADLNKFLTNTIEETELLTIEGECINSTEVSFEFQTSDDSPESLFSNVATLFIDDVHVVQQFTAPTVSSTTDWYSGEQYQFKTRDFTTDFQDADGDSYKYVRINTPFTSTTGNIIEGIEINNQEIDYPIEIDLTNSLDLTFEISPEYNYFNERLYKYEGDLISQIKDLETQGYTILENKGNELIFNKLNSTVEHTTIKGKDIGDGNICLTFQTSDDSEYNLFSVDESFCLTFQGGNIPPTVDDYNETIISTFTFPQEAFTQNFNKQPKAVRIEAESDSTLGQLLFKDKQWNLPYSFPIEEVNELEYKLPNRFVYIDNELYSFDKNYEDILVENSDYELIDNEGGILIFEKEVNGITENKYIVGNTVTTEDVIIRFRTSDSNDIPLFSNQAEVVLTVPSKETPIEFNEPPTVGDTEIVLDEDCRITETPNPEDGVFSEQFNEKFS